MGDFKFSAGQLALVSHDIHERIPNLTMVSAMRGFRPDRRLLPIHTVVDKMAVVTTWQLLKPLDQKCRLYIASRSWHFKPPQSYRAVPAEVLGQPP